MVETILNKPTNAVNLSLKPRILNAQFGDGYSQRSPDGINNIVEIWDVTFEYADKSIRDTLNDTLKDFGGVNYFLWTPPYESSTKKFICQEWTQPLNDQGSYALNAKFIQVFEV